jgi:hypothetical protein
MPKSPKRAPKSGADAGSRNGRPLEPWEEIRRALQVLFEPGQVVELRVPNHPRGNATTAGYFDDFAELAKEAEVLSGKAPGVYVTLNRINPALLARQNNRVEEWVKHTTGDADVLRRRWLPLDFDPVRPSGFSSTDAEHEAALKRAGECREWLTGQGWTEPVVADSGNGAHLLYAIDLPNDEPSRLLVEGCLQALAARFSDKSVTIDTKVGNAARIWKLYGTLSCKGDSTNDRPHRLARILSVPELVQVTADQLKELAAEAVGSNGHPESNGQANGQGNGQAQPRLDVPRWLADRGVSFKVKKPKGSDPRTVYRITCPFDPAHTDAAVMQGPDGKLSAKCFHNSCSDRGWQEFKEQIGPPDTSHYDPPPGAAEADEVPRGWFANGVPGVNGVNGALPGLGEDAYLGVAGEFLNAVRPYSEATDAGVLAHFLTAAGMLAGPSVHVWGGGKQPPRVNAVLVGDTNEGRKGTSLAPVDLLMGQVAGAFWAEQRMTGLSSGEGLIAYVADRVETDEDGNAVVVEVEKRLYVVEEEFTRVLANTRREGNVLSQVIRSAFDGGNLATLTIKPRRASGAHVVIAAHITPEDLKAHLTSTEMANGFGNRFLWFFVKSDRIIPHTEPIPPEVFEPFVGRFRALRFLGALQKSDHPVRMDDGARELWAKVYRERLRKDRPGLAGKVVSRGGPMVLRLALIYALLGCKLVKGMTIPTTPDLKSLMILAEHLKAALAVWDYCEKSAYRLFKDRSGDPLGDKLLQLLAVPMTRDQMRGHLSHQQNADCALALARLEAAGLVRRRKVSTGGRPAEVWERADRPENPENPENPDDSPAGEATEHPDNPDNLGN